MSAIYPWQVGLWQSLCHLSQQKRLPHALLLAAPQGLGKAHFARQFAAWRLCEQPSADSVCRVCRSCQLLSTGHHPDLLWVSPDEDDEKGTKASKVIKVAQVRTVVEFATQSAHRQGGQRIVVIEPADALNTASANALLKTLEEPPSTTLFLLVCSDPQKLLATILSRTQRVKIPMVEEHAIADFLVEQSSIDSQKALQLAQSAEGNISWALEKSKTENLSTSTWFAEWMRAIYSKNLSKLVILADQFDGFAKEDQKGLLEYSLHVLRQCLYQISGAPQLIKSLEKEKKFIDNFSKTLSQEKIEKMSSKVSDVHYHLERNARAKMVHLDLSLQFVRIYHAQQKA